MIDGTSNAATFDALGLSQQKATPQSSDDKLGQSDFLTLMITQLKSQDPVNPMDSEAFMGQIAQFSTVEGIQQLNESFNGLASSLVSNQVLEASQLVGHSVMVPGGIGSMTSEDGMSGAVELPELVPDLQLKVYDSAGQLVRTVSMQGSGPGLVDFKWDGLDDSGKTLPPGQYQFAVEGTVDDQTQRFDTYKLADVTSVSVDPDQGSLMLQTEGFGEISFDEIRRIA